MILTCPHCSTRYQTDAAQFMPEGRKVRCAKCGHVWFQNAPAPEPEVPVVREEAPPPQPEPEPEPEPVYSRRTAYAPPEPDYEEEEDVREVARPRSRLLPRLGLAIGWMALFAIVGGACWAGVHFRQDIASLWPQSATLYRAVGLKVNTLGIEIHNRLAQFETENGQSVLLITGNVVNITSHELSVPPIRVSLSDDDRRELYHWNFSSSVATLGPGQSAAFRTRLPSPPLTARHIELRFSERGN